MIGLMPIFVLGALILVFCGRLLLQWRKGRHAQPVRIEDFTQARAALDAMFLEVTATKRIFAIDDMEFVSLHGASEVLRLFEKERQLLAVRWLRLTQKQVAQLMDIHLKLASYTFEPSPRFEFRLTVNYFCFVVVSNALLMLLWLRGPFNAVRIVDYTLGVTHYFSSVFSLRLEKIDPVKLGLPAILGSSNVRKH
jgi:hypothetical protein